jgi:hypothetical protein
MNIPISIALVLLLLASGAIKNALDESVLKAGKS